MTPSRHASLQWAGLVLLSALLVAGLEALRLPAALLIGTMAAAGLVAWGGGTIRLPAVLFYAAQALLGCLIARSMPFATLAEMLRDWPLFAVTILSVVAASAGLGWILTRRGVLPGTAGVWGAQPGAATAMVVMAEAFGADIRLVAVMQYLRVVCVVLAASVVSGLLTAGLHGGAPAPVAWFPPVAWGPLAETLGFAAVAATAARCLGIPAGAMLVPLAAGVAFQDAGWLRLDLPPWLLALAYAFLGWSIGLRFTRPIILNALEALPRMLGAIFALIVLSGALAAALVVFAGVDPLTAYLATSPGGADSMAVIAASSKVDMAFVMAMQTGRFLVVLLAGPTVARFVATRCLRAARPDETPRPAGTSQPENRRPTG